MLKSMTGYGRGEVSKYNRVFTVEIKAVNNRYSDISVKLPRILNKFENDIKSFIGTTVFRGKVDVYIKFQSFSENDISISLNESLAEAYIEELIKLKNKYTLSGEISLELVAKFPDLITFENDLENDETTKEIKETLFEALEIAIHEFVKMREVEGEHLRKDILNKLEIMSEYLGEVKKSSVNVQKEYEEKLRNKVRDALGSAEIDQSRLLTEITIFCDKSSIDEEITRFDSHILQLHHILESDDVVGRKLDFLVQEMNREVNTIGSKSGDVSIIGNVVKLKSELEKIREQIQNIE